MNVHLVGVEDNYVGPPTRPFKQTMTSALSPSSLIHPQPPFPPKHEAQPLGFTTATLESKIVDRVWC